MLLKHMLFLVFGIGLCLQFNPTENSAPPFVEKCITELEFQANTVPSVDLYKLYRTRANVDSIQDLCDLINKGLIFIHSFNRRN